MGAQELDQLKIYNNRIVYKESERDRILEKMETAGYRCVDVGGSSPDFADHISVEYNEGLSFAYVKHRGPDVTVYNYICLRPGERAVINSKGHEYRGHHEWNEKVEYKNVDGKIISSRIEGWSDITPAFKAHRIERAKISDVRDFL